MLVIRGGAIGDFILTLPALAALRARYPNARLELLANPQVARLAVAGGLADGARSLDAPELAGFFSRDARLDASCAKFFGGFDLVVSYLFDPDGVFQTNVARGCRGRFGTGCRGEVSGWLRADSARSRRLVRRRRNAELRGAPADSQLDGSRISAQPDFEDSVRQRN